jgi:hypothetical protein
VFHMRRSATSLLLRQPHGLVPAGPVALLVADPAEEVVYARVAAAQDGSLSQA